MDAREIRRHDARLRELTGALRRSRGSEKPRDFLCPILQLEERVPLCKGHIVPKAVRGRTWVVQRKDVDNFYGSFAEADFIHGVRLRAMLTFEDAMQYVLKHGLARRADLSIHDGEGAKATVHPARKGDGGQEVVVRSLDGSIDLDGDLSLSINFDAAQETLLTCLHTAHLGNFEGSGYRYATSRSGRFVANLLRDVYLRFSRRGHSIDREELAAMCRVHVNMARPVSSVDGLDRELLKDPFRSFVICWCGDAVFATVHFLQADSEWNAVMLYADVDSRAIAMMASQTPVSFKVTLGRIENGVIQARPVGENSSTFVWPCGERSDVNQPVPIETVVARLPPWPSNSRYDR